MRRWLGLIAVSAVLAAGPGLAAGLSSSARSLGGSSATVGRCDTDGVGVVQNLSGSNVVSVTVSSIASACGGGSISVTVNNGSTNVNGATVVPAGGGSVTVTLGTSIAQTESMTTDLAIVGA